MFVNVSDSWRAPKSARVWVGAAGIFVELIIACLAAWIWLLTQPGLLHQLAFNTMFLASISTVVFNANPLLKFDGYYILIDLIETPNLKQKSNAYITWWAQKFLLGMHQTPLRLATWELSPLFGIYAVLSYLYGWFILYKIAFLIFDILEPFGLSFLSRTYVALFLFTSLALPIYRLMKTVRQSPEFSPVVRPRLHRAAWAALILIGLLFILPWRDTIKRSAVLEHGKVELITSKTPGFLREVHVQSGQPIKKGDLLGRLENFALTSELRELELELEGLEVRYRAAFTDPDPNIRNSAAAIKKLQEELHEQITARQELLSALELRAPADGIVRTLRPQELEGLYFPAGQPILEIGHTGPLRVIIALNEREARRVHAGQSARVKFTSLPGFTLEGQIAGEPVAGLLEFSSPLLANMAGGDVPSEAGPNQQLIPSVPHYEAEVYLNPPSETIPAGLLGRARIDAGHTTLGVWLYQRALDQIDPSIRL
jgi:putative peptide zinc metalloprotease protein